MAVEASGSPMIELIEKHVLAPLGMNETIFDGAIGDGNIENPHLSGGIATNAIDYEKFLIAMTNYDDALLPKALIDEMDTDQYPSGKFGGYGQFNAHPRP